MYLYNECFNFNDEKNINENKQKGRSPHINEIKYHIYTQMNYEEYYAEFVQKTDEFL